jgi:hypothetical protein
MMQQLAPAPGQVIPGQLLNVGPPSSTGPPLSSPPLSSPAPLLLLPVPLLELPPLLLPELPLPLLEPPASGVFDGFDELPHATATATPIPPKAARTRSLTDLMDILQQTTRARTLSALAHLAASHVRRDVRFGLLDL